ncbi:hypothetical protein [Lacticaseibacillus hegangensis]|uniref:Uncharacterized protein n=1 Tax=Lacticaseibacillus hegangensis TaxID=2486010 RepID=A0ABW4CYX5_9LACO|nr:hypothetical protein [Lacticaseibacillus hegangensis]
MTVPYKDFGDNRWRVLADYSDCYVRHAMELVYECIAEDVPYNVVSDYLDADTNKHSDNVVCIGTRKTSALIAQFISSDEVPSHGFLVKVGVSPFNENRQVVWLVGDDPVATIYASSHFVHQYLPQARQRKDHIPYFRKLFVDPLPKYIFSPSLQFKCNTLTTRPKRP